MIITKIIKQYIEEDEIIKLDVSRRDNLFTIVIANKSNDMIEINKHIPRNIFSSSDKDEYSDEDAEEFIETVKQLMEYNVQRNLPF